VSVLLEPEGGKRERGPRHRGAAAPQPELPSEQVGAGERKRVGEQEQEVVAEHGGVGAGAEERRRCVSDERVGERERVV